MHGHNWGIHLTLASDELDACGFVADFGNLRYLKNWIDENLDHACLIGKKDPILPIIQEQLADAFKLYIVPFASCEGLAEHLFHLFNTMVKKETNGRVWITKIRVSETDKNSAEFSLS